MNIHNCHDIQQQIFEPKSNTIGEGSPLSVEQQRTVILSYFQCQQCMSGLYQPVVLIKEKQ